MPETLICYKLLSAVNTDDDDDDDDEDDADADADYNS